MFNGLGETRPSFTINRALGSSAPQQEVGKS